MTSSKETIVDIYQVVHVSVYEATDLYLRFDVYKETVEETIIGPVTDSIPIITTVLTNITQDDRIFINEVIKPLSSSIVTSSGHVSYEIFDQSRIFYPSFIMQSIVNSLKESFNDED
jgi:hypothetical protein